MRVRRSTDNEESRNADEESRDATDAPPSSSTTSDLIAERGTTSLDRSLPNPSDANNEAVVSSLERTTSMGDTNELKEVLNLALAAATVVAPLWFLAQLTFNASLRLTSVTSNTILSSASALFTYLFSVLVLSEKFTATKFACVLALMGGTAMVTIADARASTINAEHSKLAFAVSESGLDTHHSVVGDMLCLVSSIVYGGYTVAIRVMLGNDESSPTMLFFGLMGGLIFVSVGPFLGISAALGSSLGTLTWKTFGLVVLKGLFDNVLSDYLWARAILLVGPTIATSGLAMQVPIAIVLDVVLGRSEWMKSVATALLTFLGGIVILVGFFGITASGRSPSPYTIIDGTSTSAPDHGQDFDDSLPAFSSMKEDGVYYESPRSRLHRHDAWAGDRREAQTAIEEANVEVVALRTQDLQTHDNSDERPQ